MAYEGVQVKLGQALLFIKAAQRKFL